MNSIPFDDSHNLSQEFIGKMKELHNSYVDLDNIEEYIEKNAKKIAKYVYWNEKINKDHVNRIKNFKGKISRWIRFCFRAKPWLNREDIANELQIISAFQAIILDSKNERLKYVYYNYEQKGNHHSDVSVGAALRTDDCVLDILKCYWVRKVADRWYENIGRWDVRVQARRLEDVCDGILIEILSKSSLDEMEKIHNMYMARIDLGLITAKKQIMVTMELEKYLFNKGFTYIDDGYRIRYIFSNPKEVKETYNVLVKFLNDTIQDKSASLEMIIPSINIVNNAQILFNVLFSFDYQRKECILKDNRYRYRYLVF